VPRHEVAVRTTIAFHTRNPPFDVFQIEPEQVTISFEGRDFVWHANLEPGPGGEEWWPGVTVVVVDHNNYDQERELMHRFLSALTYELEEPMEVLSGGGTGVADPLAPPVPRAMRRGFGNQIRDAPAAIEVTDDERLRLVLALYREGKNSESPFYRFLSYWNALDASFDNDVKRISGFLDAEANRYSRGFDFKMRPKSWSKYLYDSNRCAIAHAVRVPGKPVLDPDLPDDRARLDRDSQLLERLVRLAVEHRWPGPVRGKRRI
jgi:hypothetical protein